MAKRITWIGIDDHKLHLSVAVVTSMRSRDPEVRRVENEDRALQRWVRRLEREAGGGVVPLEAVREVPFPGPSMEFRTGNIHGPGVHPEQ